MTRKKLFLAITMALVITILSAGPWPGPMAASEPCVLNAWFEPTLSALVTTGEWVKGTLHLQNVLLTPLKVQVSFSAISGEIRFAPLAFALTLGPEEKFSEDFYFRVRSEGEFSFETNVIRQDDGVLCKTLSHSGVAMILKRIYLPLVVRWPQIPTPTPTPEPIVTVPAP